MPKDENNNEEQPKKPEKYEFQGFKENKEVPEEPSCLWEEIMNNLWMKWGKVRETYFIDEQNDTHKTYLLLNDSFKYSERLALQKEKELKDVLMKERKLTVILDLDNTLLHSKAFHGYAHSISHFGRIYPGKDLFQLPLDPRAGMTTHTKLRPFVKLFIEMILPLYRIYIYTMGNRKYADSVVKILNREIPDFKMDSKRVITRDDGHQHTNGRMIKTLRQLSPTDESFYIILDDRRDVWSESIANLLQVYPYVYFPGNDQLMLRAYPKFFKNFLEEDIDPSLLHYGAYLKKIHDKYFEIYDQKGQWQELDLRIIHKECREKLFHGLKCAYVQFFNSKTDNQKESYEWTQSERRGMQNMLEYKSGETNLVITFDRELKDPILKQAKEDGCKIVTGTWMHMSIHLNTVLPFEIFEPKPIEEIKINDETQEGSKSTDPDEEKDLKNAKRERAKKEYREIVHKIVSYHLSLSIILE